MITLFFLTILFSSEELTTLGNQIWKNECRGKVNGSTHWNEGEEFPSFGIGHFIWYVEGKTGPFQETFPSLLLFLKQRGIALPPWLQNAKGAPWSSKKEFDALQDSEKMKELRQFLVETVSLQASFMKERLESAEKKFSSVHFKTLLKTPQGTFALLDYLNFKGEGLLSTERYQGEGWGLYQVLDEMKSTENPLKEFVRAAKLVLERRVFLAPKERNEERWLKGWQNRVNSYLDS